MVLPHSSNRYLTWVPNIDKAVLENYHVASTFELLKDTQYNIFENASKADYKSIREKMIALVLATDMSQHFAELGLMKTRIAAG